MNPIRIALKVEMLLSLVALVAVSACAVKKSLYKSDKPSLVVLLVFDQLRGDLLPLYSKDLDGGFRTLLDDGFVYTDARVDHALTVSLSGHASIATGSMPSRHGFVGNEYWGRNEDGAWWYQSLVADPQYALLGSTSEFGYSPAKLETNSIGDWFNAGDKGGRSFVLAVGSEISVPYGGKTGRSVYNYSTQTGTFTTSAYYQKTLPQWLTEFNNDVLPTWVNRSLIWERQAGASSSRPRTDSAPYENDGVHTTFPHSFVVEGSDTGVQSLNSWFKTTPYADLAMLKLAEVGLSAEQLGDDGVTDLLVLVFNGTDNVGHAFGPLSVEQYENLKLLDAALGSFFERLDETIGEGKYIVALTGDHGVMNIPEYEQEQGRPGTRVTHDQIEDLLDQVEVAVTNSTLSETETTDLVVRVLEGAPFVEKAWTRDELLADPAPSEIARLYKNNLFEDRIDPFPLWTNKERDHHPSAYGIYSQLKENTIYDSAPAVHGSPYLYDRHVPVIFYGRGINAGTSKRQVRTIDIAPTIAELAGVSINVEIDGVSLVEDLQGGKE